MWDQLWSARIRQQTKFQASPMKKKGKSLKDWTSNIWMKWDNCRWSDKQVAAIKARPNANMLPP